MRKLKKTERILGLINVLKKFTDEENELKIREIMEHLQEEFGEDFEIHEMSVSRDLKELQQSRYIDLIVNSDGEGKPKYYSYKNRLFEIQELRLLMDAISSARFITKSEKEKMIAKIKQLTSIPLANNLVNEIYIDDYAIDEAKTVKYRIFSLHNAIQEKKVIRFIYGRYNIDKEFVLSNDGKPRVLHPYALIWKNDYYYLIGKYEKEGEMVHFRVDRMVDVEVTDETFELDPDFEISSYVRQLFHMFAGVEKTLKVRFHNRLINVIIDRFGKNISVKKDGEDFFIIETKAMISDGLVSWLLTWGNNAQVIAPPELVEKLKDESKKIYDLYHSEK